VKQTAEVKGRASFAGRDQYNVKVSNVIILPLLPELAGMLKELPDALADFYQVASETGAPIPANSSLDDLLGWLAELITQRGEFPRPLQVSELAATHAADAATRDTLRSIGERWAAAVPGGQDSLASFRESSASGEEQQGDPCLLIILDQDRNGDDHYRLSLVLYRNGRDGVPQPGDDVYRPVDKIQARLRECLPALFHTTSRGSLLIEFAVPSRLLDTDFDQWSVPYRPNGPPGRDYQLGEKYPVVVRDLERMAPGGDRSLWEARWERLRNCVDSSPGAVFWVGPRESDSGSLRARLRLKDSHGQVCLGLLPAPSVLSCFADLLEAGFDTGIPAAIWLRPPKPGAGRQNDKKDKRYLKGKIRPRELSVLPYKVQDLRLQALADRTPAAHPGRRLSLLWADPGRTWEPLAEPPPSTNGDDI
jgi:hypothetical protein